MFPFSWKKSIYCILEKVNLKWEGSARARLICCRMRPDTSTSVTFEDTSPLCLGELYNTGWKQNHSVLGWDVELFCCREIHLIIDQELLRVKIQRVWFGHKSNTATPINLSKVECKVNLQEKTTSAFKAIMWLQKTQKMAQKPYGVWTTFTILLWCYLSFLSLKTPVLIQLRLLYIHLKKNLLHSKEISQSCRF